MRERLAYLIMIGMLLVLVTFVMLVVGKGEYQPPPPEPPPDQQEQGSASPDDLLRERPAARKGPVVNATVAR